MFGWALAGAAVVGPAEEPGIGPVVWGSDGEQFDLIRQREDWRDVLGADRPDMPHLTMQGNAVFRWAAFEMAKVAQATLDRTGLSINYSAEPVYDVKGTPRWKLKPDVPTPPGADILAAGIKELKRLASR